MIELIEIMADKIRQTGASALADEYERGDVGLYEVYRRLPHHAEALKGFAEKITLTGYYAYISSPRAQVGWGKIK